MLEKLLWFIVFGIRGGIHAVPFIALAGVFTLIDSALHSITETGSFAMMSSYISCGLTLFALCSLITAAVIWIVTWIEDCFTGYLPNWIRKDLY